MERWRKQISPAKAPQDDTFGTRQYARQEHGCGSIVGKSITARHFVKCACRQASCRKVLIDVRHAEGQHRVTHTCGFDTRDSRAKFINDGGLAHRLRGLGMREIRSLNVLTLSRVESSGSASNDDQTRRDLQSISCSVSASAWSGAR